MKNGLKLDIFPHIFPQPYFERMRKVAGSNPALSATIMRWLNIPVLWNLDARMRMMKDFRGYKQILTLSLPAIELLAGPEESPALARLANDGMAEIVALHPDQFPAFVASLPMNNVPAALRRWTARSPGSARRASRYSPTSTAGRSTTRSSFRSSSAA